MFVDESGGNVELSNGAVSCVRVQKGGLSVGAAGKLLYRLL